jgi:hypothetical protein
MSAFMSPRSISFITYPPPSSPTAMPPPVNNSRDELLVCSGTHLNQDNPYSDSKLAGKAVRTPLLHPFSQKDLQGPVPRLTVFRLSVIVDRDTNP